MTSFSFLQIWSLTSTYSLSIIYFLIYAQNISNIAAFQHILKLEHELAKFKFMRNGLDMHIKISFHCRQLSVGRFYFYLWLDKEVIIGKLLFFVLWNNEIILALFQENHYHTKYFIICIWIHWKILVTISICKVYDRGIYFIIKTIVLPFIPIFWYLLFFLKFLVFTL